MIADFTDDLGKIAGKPILHFLPLPAFSRSVFSAVYKLHFPIENQQAFEDALAMSFDDLQPEENLYLSPNVSIMETLNGILVFDIEKKTVTKLLSCELEPLFLDNEVRASNLHLNNSPQLLAYGRIGRNAYVVSTLVERAKKCTWETWSNNLEGIFSMLWQTCRPIEALPATTYRDLWEQDLEVNLSEFHFLSSEFLHAKVSLLQVVDLLLGEQNVTNLKSYKMFSHGDLTPNNVFCIGDNQLCVFDWANGGEQNFTYDLMLLNYYFVNHATWRHFFAIDFMQKDEEKIFFGQCKSFFANFQKLYGVTLSNPEIRLGIIFALGELMLKNFLRYQSHHYYRDGVKMLDQVTQICAHIANSYGKN